MVYRPNSDDFYDYLANQEKPYADADSRLVVANTATRVIANMGGVFSGRSLDLFMHAMVGLPELPGSNVHTALATNYEGYMPGLWRLANQFSSRTADMPFIPSEDKDRCTFTVPGSELALPRRVYIRGGEPFAPMPQGSGLGDKDTSIEYRVSRHPITGIVTGQVVARECFEVDLAEIMEARQSLRVTQIVVNRHEVELYRCTRNEESLPETMPVVEPAVFGNNILAACNPNVTVGDLGSALHATQLERGLLSAVKVAQHRGDYNGLPVDSRSW